MGSKKRPSDADEQGWKTKRPQSSPEDAISPYHKLVAASIEFEKTHSIPNTGPNIQWNTCKICQTYWRWEDGKPMASVNNAPKCFVHGHKRRPPNTPPNFWKMQLTPPKSIEKKFLYEYEKRELLKKNLFKN